MNMTTAPRPEKLPELPEKFSAIHIAGGNHAVYTSSQMHEMYRQGWKEALAASEPGEVAGYQFRLRGTSQEWASTTLAPENWPLNPGWEYRTVYTTPVAAQVSDPLADDGPGVLQSRRDFVEQWRRTLDGDGHDVIANRNTVRRFVAVIDSLTNRRAQPQQVGESLLRSDSEALPAGCYCKPGQCMAPTIMGRQQPCRDPEKAALQVKPS
jgi:hypothetical protein